MIKLYSIQKIKNINYRWEYSTVTYNDICSLTNEDDTTKILSNRNIMFNRFKVVDNKEEVLEDLKAHTFHLTLQGINLNITIDEDNHLLFDGQESLAYFYLAKDFSLRECNNLSKYILANKNVICCDKEVFFKGKQNSFDIMNYLDNVVKSKNYEFAISFIDNINYTYLLETRPEKFRF